MISTYGSGVLRSAGKEHKEAFNSYQENYTGEKEKGRGKWIRKKSEKLLCGIERVSFQLSKI